MSTKKREEFDKDLKHLFKCIDWGKSWLDAEAIGFLNEIGNRIDELVVEGREL